MIAVEYSRLEQWGNIVAGFGLWLKEARQRARMTLEDLAEEMNTSHPTISRWENERVTPKRSTVIRLAEKLKADVNQGLLAAGYTPENPSGQTLTYVTESVITQAVKLMEGLPPELQQAGIESLKGLKNAADMQREFRNSQSIGKRADREENPSQRASETPGDDE